MPSAPSHTDLIDDEHDGRSEHGRAPATPADHLVSAVRGDRVPGAGDRSQEKMDDGDCGLQIHRQRRPEERGWPIRAGVQELHHSSHDVGLYRGDAAAPEMPAAEECSDGHDDPDAEQRRPQVDRLPPFTVHFAPANLIPQSGGSARSPSG